MHVVRLPQELQGRQRLSFVTYPLLAVLLFVLLFAGAYHTLDPWTLNDLLEPVIDWLVAVVLALAVAVVALLVVLRARLPAINQTNSEGLRLLALGRHGEAAAIFAAVERRHRWMWSVRIVARWNLAMALLLQGRIDQALAGYGGLHREPYARALAYVWEGLPSQVALCYALRGGFAEAEGALAEQRRRRVQTHLVSWVLPEAILHCRQGRPADAVALLEGQERALDGGGSLARAIRLVHAFALSEVGAELQPALRAVVEGSSAADVAWAATWPAFTAWFEGQRRGATA